MGEKDEREAALPTLTFPFLHIPPSTMDSPDHPSGMTTPPLHTSASIPFRWEEQPGKPRPCSDIVPRPEPARSLDLPPCRLFPKTPSPTTVLDGPYNVGRPKFSSFRLFREAQDSFDSFSCGSTPEGLDSLLGGKKGVKTGGLFGKFSSGKKGLDGGSCRFSPSSVSSYESEERCVGGKNDGGVKMRSKSSFYSAPQAAKPHIWESIYEGIKQAVRWKSKRKSNKEGRD